MEAGLCLGSGLGVVDQDRGVQDQGPSVETDDPSREGCEQVACLWVGGRIVGGLRATGVVLLAGEVREGLPELLPSHSRPRQGEGEKGESKEGEDRDHFETGLKSLCSLPWCGRHRPASRRSRR